MESGQLEAYIRYLLETDGAPDFEGVTADKAIKARAVDLMQRGMGMDDAIKKAQDEALAAMDGKKEQTKLERAEGCAERAWRYSERVTKENKKLKKQLGIASPPVERALPRIKEEIEFEKANKARNRAFIEMRKAKLRARYEREGKPIPRSLLPRESKPAKESAKPATEKLAAQKPSAAPAPTLEGDADLDALLALLTENDDAQTTGSTQGSTAHVAASDGNPPSQPSNPIPDAGRADAPASQGGPEHQVA